MASWRYSTADPEADGGRYILLWTIIPTTFDTHLT